ncbi:hypothetical protein BC938DRAFT_483337, partial [Jimgerdemannia flammicorona]
MPYREKNKKATELSQNGKENSISSPPLHPTFISEQIKTRTPDYARLQAYFATNHLFYALTPLTSPATHSGTPHHPPKRKLSFPPPLMRPTPTQRATSSTTAISSVRIHLPPHRSRNRAASLTHAPFSPSMATYPGAPALPSTPTTPGGSNISHVVPPDPAHPAHRFPEFVRLFGPNVFVLWKAALLKRRIVFLVPAPVERGCYFG